MRILLIHPPVRINTLPSSLPLGLAYVASALKSEGIDCHVLDLNMARLTHDPGWLLRQTVRYGKFSHVGVSAIVTQFAAVERIVQLVREVQPEMPIIVGGPISVLGEKLHTWLKVCAYRGEGENLFGACLRLGEYRASVCGAPNPVDVDKIPWPDWSAFSLKYFRHPVGWLNTNKWRGGQAAQAEVPSSMNMTWARGCPYKCTFCSRGSAPQTYRKRSPEGIVREMEFLWRRYDTRVFHTSDDNTVLDKSWLRDVCTGIQFHPELKNCTWGCAGRADCIDLGTLAVMREAGCRLVGVGVESGSQKVLDSYRKGTSVADNERAILACRETFGAANFSLMVGSEAEDDESIAATIDLCRRTASRPEVVFFTTALPGSRLYEQALERKLIIDELAYVRSLGEMGAKPLVNFTEQSTDWLVDAKRRIEDATGDLAGAI